MKKQAKWLFDKLGIDVKLKKPGTRYGNIPGYYRLNRLPKINTVIDVGVGHRGSPFLYDKGWDAYYICIDPLDEAAAFVDQTLPKNRFAFFKCAVGSKSEDQISFNVSSVPSRTSLLGRIFHDASSAPKESRTTAVKRLDDIIDRSKVQAPSLLKIDIEGAELECLRGGRETVRVVDYILLELPLTSNYSEMYRFSDVIAFLAGAQFEPLMVLKAGNNSMDVLFSKQNDPLRTELSYGSR